MTFIYIGLFIFKWFILEIMNNDELINTIQSPCVGNCCLDDEDICLGCFRSMDEILGWSASSDEERRAILNETVSRRK